MGNWLDWLKEKLGMDQGTPAPARPAKASTNRPGPARSGPAKPAPTPARPASAATPARPGSAATPGGKNPPTPARPGPGTAAAETTEQAFARLCKMGNAANALLIPGKYPEAVRAFQAIFDDQFARKQIDTYLMAKAALGIMLAHVQLGQFEEAHSVWLGGQDERWQIGIQSLDSGALSVSDTILYMQLTAFFHSLSAGDKEQATAAVNSICERLCTYYQENEPDLLPEMLNQWRLYLDEIHEKRVPTDAQKELKAFAASAGANPSGYGKLKLIRTPEPWESPGDVVEVITPSS
jgi:hypothetical protein